MERGMSRIFSKILVLLLILSILLFSKTVLQKAFGVPECQNVSTTNAMPQFQESNSKINGKCNVSVFLGEKNEKPLCKMKVPENCPKVPNNSPAEITIHKEKIVNFYPILCIVFVLCLTGTLISLIAILLKDDSGIRYAKLDMLQEFKPDFFDCFNSDEWETETTTTVEKTSGSNEKVVEPKKETEKSIKKDLLKHYMNCIMEI